MMLPDALRLVTRRITLEIKLGLPRWETISIMENAGAENAGALKLQYVKNTGLKK